MRERHELQEVLGAVKRVDELYAFVLRDEYGARLNRSKIIAACDTAVLVFEDTGWLGVRAFPADTAHALLSRTAAGIAEAYEGACEPCPLSDLFFDEHDGLSVGRIECFYYDAPDEPAGKLFALRIHTEGGWVCVETPHFGGITVTAGKSDPATTFPGRVTAAHAPTPPD